MDSQSEEQMKEVGRTIIDIVAAVDENQNNDNGEDTEGADAAMHNSEPDLLKARAFLRVQMEKIEVRMKTEDQVARMMLLQAAQGRERGSKDKARLQQRIEVGRT